MKKLITIAIVVGVSGSAWAEVILPKIISSKMVLQHGAEAPIWGWADPGEKVTVSFAGQSKTATADEKTRKWMVTLDPLQISAENSVMTIKGNNEIKVEDILVGEVWLASGQSNMEWDFMRVDKAERDYAMKHADNTLLRAFHVNEHLTSGTPLDDTVGLWKTSNDMVGEDGIKLGLQKGISAVGFLFALKLQQELGVPIAFIDSNWGGRRIENFTPDEGFAAVGIPYKRKGNVWTVAEYKSRLKAKQASLATLLKEAKEGEEIPPKTVGSLGIRVRKGGTASPKQIEKTINEMQRSVSEALKAAGQGIRVPVAIRGFSGVADNDIYNAMIAPLTPYAISGAIWYQGESNRTDSQYFERLQALSKGWSQVFNVKDIPLYLVQIAPYNYNKRGKPGELDSTLSNNIWAAQYKGAKEIPGMEVVAIHDTNIPINNIHPPHKLPVGNRLAMMALNKKYGKDVVAAGPSFAAAKLNGSTVVVSFTGIDQGLSTKDGKEPSWFELSADGETFVKSDAKIAGNTVEVSSAEVTTPKFVRMGWYDTAIPTLQDKNGWPVFAFPAKPVK